MYSHHPQLFVGRIVTQAQHCMLRCVPIAAISLCFLVPFETVPAQTWQSASMSRPWCDHVIVPQSYRNASPGSVSGSSDRLQVQQIQAKIDIRGQVARTQMWITIHNPTQQQQSAELLVPVVAGSVVREFTFQGEGAEPSTELLEKAHARRTFESIVAKLRDPALLEFAGYNLVRTSVFPVMAGAEQTVVFTTEQLLPNDNHRIDYILPRSPSLVSDVPWKIDATIKSPTQISTVYSPSHQIAVQRTGDKEVSLSLPTNSMAPGAFQLSYLQAAGPLTASLMTAADATGGGHFLLLAGLGHDTDAKPTKNVRKVRREVTLTIDTSGSMSGGKMEQAKQAAIQVVSGLEMGEYFNLIPFNSSIDSFSTKAVVKSADSMQRAIEYIQSMNATGGTNIHDALLQSLASDVPEGCLPIVLFLTDGNPTAGNTSEVAIRDVAEKQNPHSRRIFSFGVGFDVNTPLLDKLATGSRGLATFVTTGENVEVAVSKVFRSLSGPIYSDLKLQIANQTEDQPSRIYELMPKRLPDLYEGDQLTLLGRYRGSGPLAFHITGKQGDRDVTFDFEFDPSQNASQSFVPRLWASRKIADLIEQVRDMGAGMSSPAGLSRAAGSQLVSASNSTTPPIDPALLELTNSIVAISKQYGILTEYTSFLATEGVDLSDTHAVTQQVSNTLVQRAMLCRDGIGSWNQEANSIQLRSQSYLNLSNRYIDPSGNWVSTATILQCRGNSLYNRAGRWIEAKMIDQPKVEPERTIEFGSQEYMELLWKLVAEQRQDEMAVEGDLLITIDGVATLIRGPASVASEAMQDDH